MTDVNKKDCPGQDLSRRFLISSNQDPCLIFFVSQDEEDAYDAAVH